MKLYRYFLLVLVVFGSCKSSKDLSDSSGTIKEISSRKISRKHHGLSYPKTVDAKLKVNYKDTKENLNFSVKLKMIHNEVIWLKGTKIITVFKAKITPEKVEFYSPYKKNYFQGDFSMLQKVLGVDINFNQLQNLLLGQTINSLKAKKHEVDIEFNSYKVYPKEQHVLFDLFYFLNPNSFKVTKQFLVNTTQQQRLDINYPKYIQKKGVLFPEKIEIKAKETNKFTNIDLNVRSVEFNSKLSMPFKIPSGYSEIQL